MRVIEEFSFDEEPGKTQVKSNITESVEKPNISIFPGKMNIPVKNLMKNYLPIRDPIRPLKNRPS